MEDIKLRLQAVAKYKGLSIRAFETYCGLNRGVISNIGPKGSIGVDKLSKIVDNIPEISTDWLLTGHGNMLRDSDSLENNMEYIETKPRIPLDAAAGSLSIITQSIEGEECERFPVIKCFPKYDFTIIVKGNSMEPEFHSGDEVACRFIDQPTFIQWGRPHVLDTHQGVVLKRIYNRNDTILCKSDNKEYDDFEIQKEDILHIALVVGSVRLY